MKLTHLRTDAFLAARNVDAPITTSAVLFCGPNASGKTSLRDAIGFVCLGRPGRVARKMDWKKLVSDGVRKGTVTAVIDGVGYTRALPNGKVIGENEPQFQDTALAEVLDSHAILSMTPAERRSYFFRLMRVSLKTDAIRDMLTDWIMKERHLIPGAGDELPEQDKACMAAVAPLLHSGFSAAHEYARDRASEARQAWCAATGERQYGATKGKELCDAGFTQEQFLDVDDIKNKRDRLAKQINAINEDIAREVSRWDQVHRRREFLSKKIDPSGRLEMEREAAAVAVSDQEARLKVMGRAATDQSEGLVEACPCCDEMLRRPFDMEQPLTRATISTDEEVAAEMSRVEAKATLVQLKRALDQLIMDCRNAKYAAEELASLGEETPDPRDTEEHLNMVQNRDAWQQRLNDLATMLAQAEQRVNEEVRRREAYQRAVQAHHDVDSYSIIAAAMSPDGIPAQLVANAIVPLNERMNDNARAAHSPVVRIEPDMTITVNGYEVLSKSYLWRASAFVAEAVAWYSGLKFLVLDELDVMDPLSRGPFLRWVGSLSKEYDTIIVLATLKQKPKLPPEVWTVHWIEDGRIVNEEAPA